METISNTTCTECQHCGKWTNYAGDEWHRQREQTIEQQQARIARLELGLYEIHALADGGESSMQEIANVCQAWLNEHPRQSVAEIRAQELEQWAHNAMNEAPTSDRDDGWNDALRDAKNEADRIRNEAKPTASG
jgi:hypothetical protein